MITKPLESPIVHQSYKQGSQNDSHFDISSNCVVIGSQFHMAKSAANYNTIQGNLKRGVILRDLLIKD